MTDITGPGCRVLATHLPVVYWCPECRSFVSREEVVGNAGACVTLADCDHPLDSNDEFHWECWFCGYSQLPAEWSSFHGVPTSPDVPMLVAAVDGQLDLFGE